MGHHRFIPVTLDLLILDPAEPSPGQKGGEPADDQEVIDDLIRSIKGLSPRNRKGKAYKMKDVKQRG